MRKKIDISLIILVIILFSFFSCEPVWNLETIAPCPTISSVEPNTARSGDLITIKGEFIDFDSIRDRVIVGGVDVKAESVNGNPINEIKVLVPLNISADNVSVVVDIDGCRSDDAAEGELYINYSGVTVNGFSPMMARRGDEISISGTNFREDESLNIVTFGDVQGTVVSASETLLKVIVPAGAKTGDILISVDGSEVSIGVFTYQYSVVGQVEVLGTNCGSPNFLRPTGIGTDSEGNIFVADEEAHQIFRINSITKEKEFYAGDINGNSGSNSIETSLNASRFNRPWDIALDVDNNKYITDLANSQIRKIEADRVSIIASDLNLPFTITTNQKKDIYFTDITNEIKRILSGNTTVETYVGGFDIPSGVFYTNDEKLYLADSKNQKIKYIESISKAVIDVAGDGIKTFDDGPVEQASFNDPKDINVDSYNNIFVVESGNNRIRVITPTGYVYTLYGDGTSNCLGGLDRPQSLSLYEATPANLLYVADTENGVIKEIIYE